MSLEWVESRKARVLSMDDSLRASQEGLKIVKDAGRKKGWTQTVTQEWWVRANTSQATLKRFWRGYSIDGSAFRGICAAVEIDWTKVVEPSQIEELELPAVATPRENLAITTVATPTTLNSNFVGREGAFAELHTKIRQGAKVIVIQAPGGVGKTTLAQEFLSSLGFEVGLELLMAKEEANITPVESVVEEWLKRDFGEEPGRDFGVMLGRLKRQLQTKRVGVLIDNLEPALDGQGRFIAPHRRYVELLRVLADASVKSLTLITSREPLAEGLSISSYTLPSLREEAWANFFDSRGIEVEVTILKEIHRAYGGNALAMTILCDPIQREGGMGAYWQEHKIEAGLLVELAVENLVKEQFNRLEKISPEAYRLLCRLGCYRYQDVPTVPTDGLLCLLWDVPEERRRQVIKFLQSWSLVECSKGAYWLHPIIREQAISRLRKSEDWRSANQTAAEFWTESVKTFETIEDALRAFEASLHYLSIENFDEACKILVLSRDSAIHESLGQAFYRFCLFEKITSIVKYISNNINITEKFYGGKLYNIVGAMYWVKGDIHEALTYYITAKELAINFKKEYIYLTSLENIALCRLDLWEIEDAFDLFNEYKKLGEEYKEKDPITLMSYTPHKASAYFCFALINSILGFKEESLYWAEKASKEIQRVQINNPWCRNPWSRGYSLLFLGLVYKNLENLEKSRELYDNALIYAEESHYTQVKAKALYGLAELDRLQSEFEIALSRHRESIELLEEIGAKCDLAEAYYQLALTYQSMGEPDQSQEYFAKAIQLYEEMEAPKQVEKVHRAMIPPSPPTLPGRQSL